MYADNLDAMKTLIEKGAYIDNYVYGMTMLHRASWGNLKI